MTQLKWISPRRPVAMAPVWARKNINTVYHINRQVESTVRGGQYREKVSWSLIARRECQHEWITLGTFTKLKDAKRAANEDAGLA